MDANKLRAEVFEKTGIKVDTTDPIFALVALNETVLDDYARKNLAGLQEASETLQEQTRLLLEAGERTKALLLQMGHKVDDPMPPAATAKASVKPSGAPMPPLVLASVTAVLAAVLALAGQSVFAPARPLPSASQPVPPAASATGPALTAEQQQMMQNGEKFAKAWPKLDAKTQAKVQAAMQ
ncbi:MAG TPA: hypothetical protein VF472_20460 [Burkholderiaceae bacterium]